MTETLLQWLNEEIKLSKEITNIPIDFNTGYFFAELLHKLNHLPVLSQYLNSSNKKDVYHNIDNLQKNLSQIGITLDEKSKYKIINSDIYTSKIYLYKIKKLLSNKNINMEQLNYKNTNSLSKLYNSIYLKNDNEKYLSHKYRESIENSWRNSYKYNRQYNKDKYNEVYNQIKKEYSHLNLNDIDMEFIMTDIKDTEYRMNHFKNYVNKSEERNKKLNQIKSDKEYTIWFNTKKHMDNLKQKVITKSLNKLANKRSLFNSYMKFSGLSLQKESNFFEEKLSLFQEQKEKKVNTDITYDLNEEDNEEKKLREIKISQVMMANIRKKLDENLKSKKNKEKRERQKLIDNFNLKKNIFPRNTLNLCININDNTLKEITDEKNITKTVASKNSTYSRLTKGDFFTNLIDSSLNIHKGNIKIGNRMHFFKTVINKDEDNKKIKLPEIDNKERKKGFNQEDFFDELNKEFFNDFNKTLNKKKIKKQKEKNEIKPIIEQIFDIVDYVYDIQHKTNSKIIQDEIWDEIKNKFKQNILLKESEEEELLIKQLEEMKRKKKEEEEKQSFNTTNNLTANLNNFEDLYFDYINYLGFFNDIIIPHNFRTMKYSYIELYSELYCSNNNNNNILGKLDIKDYEPSEMEIENLSLPKYIKKENIYFYDILANILEYKDEGINQLKTELKNEPDKKEEKLKDYIIKNKGKYFYIPIKISFIGYPCSGKKTQGNLLKEKYPNIKIYDPEEILKNKINEYKELFEIDIDNSNPKIKNMKPAQIEQLKQEIEEKQENFKPILNIIQPYLNIIKENEVDKNNTKETLNSVYFKLLIEEINKDYNESEEDILNKLLEKKDIFNNYCQITEKINKNKKKLEEIEKELNDIQEQKEKLPLKKELTTNQTNTIKEQDSLNKELLSIKSNLFYGFIIINFPQSKKEAIELEKYFTGFELEYNKEENFITKKLKEYDIINLNYEKNNLNKNCPLISFFDLFVNFNLDINEVNQRYNNTKYDPTNGKIYTTEEITKINDKKLLERLEQGIPGLNEKEFEEKIINYEKDIYALSDFYKKMKNGFKSVYINLDQKDEEKKLLKEINTNLEKSIEEIMIRTFYENIDIIINKLKQKNNNNNELQEIQQKNISSHFEDIALTPIKDKKKHIYYDNNFSLYNDVITNIDSFYPQYKITIKSLIYLISSQRKKIILYLNKIQDDFIQYLNRPTDKNDIIPLYIEKYNKLMKMDSKLTKNQKIYEELKEDISNMNNSIWVKVQMKKKDDINYLEKIKNNGEKDKYINKFMNLIFKIYEIELEKYLIKNEIIIKYFLNKVGLLSNILGIFHQTPDEFLFKIDYKQYLYKDNINPNNMYIKTKTDLYNTLSTNETQSNFKENSNNIEKDLKKVFDNAIKIIIRQEKLNENYIEKIKSVTNKGDKDNKSNNKNTNSKDLSSKYNKKGGNTNMSMSNNNNHSTSTSKPTAPRKKSKKLLNKTEDLSMEEILNKNLTQEKNNIKYRLMYLNCFIKKYVLLINNCFDSVYSSMDDWIIMNLDTQNNKLNEFITYLKRALDKNIESISMEGREFDYNDKYFKNKKYVLPLYKSFYPEEIINLNIKFNYGNNFVNNLIKLNKLNLVQQYVYNINDLIDLYHTIKEYGIQTCDYYVKYEIVKNIFINKVIGEKEKEFFLFYGNNNKNIRIKNNDEKEKIFNGVCKRMKFYSSEKIDNFIKIFYVYENKYININELFTTLLIIGSELISSQKLNEEIKKDNKSHILLTEEQFMKINFWFENDQYLNELSDLSEQNYYRGQYNPAFSINQINSGNKKEEINNYNKTNSYSRKFSEHKKLSVKLGGKKKIEKIKETIFDINKNNDGLFDINLFKKLLDLLNNYCNKKKEGKKESINNNKVDIDENDKCFRFSSDDLDEYIYMDKNEHIKHNAQNVINNIFNNIFEK